MRLVENSIGLVEVHPTNRCNLSCKGCTYKTRNREKLPYNSIKRIAMLSPGEVRIVGGGEPTLYKDGHRSLNDYILDLRKSLPKARITLTTNGLYIPPGDWQREVEWVRVSLHGDKQNTFKAYTGQNLFDRVWYNIFQEYMVQGNIKEVQLSFVYLRDNFAEVLPLVRKACKEYAATKRNVKTRFQMLFRSFADDNAATDPFENARLSEDEIQKFRESLNLIKTNEPELCTFIQDHAKDIFKHPISERLAPPLHCEMVRNYILLAADGIFYPCCVMAACRKFNLGDMGESNAILYNNRKQCWKNVPARCQSYCRPQIGDTAKRANILKKSLERDKW